MIKRRNDSQTVIPQSSHQHHPGKNQKYVGPRSGGPSESGMTKNASIKHHNPEHFKRQTDRKDADRYGLKKDSREEKDGGPGSGTPPNSAGWSRNYAKPKKDSIPARKDIPTQHDFNHRQKNIGNDPGRGEGQIGRDRKKDQNGFQMKQFSHGTMY